MSKFLKNKTGGDKVISVYWFVIVVIVAGGVFAMVYNFYGAPYDVREIESEILANKVADCISKQGKLSSELFNSSTEEFSEFFEDNFYELCKITFETENENGWKETVQFFVEGSFYDVSGNELFVFRKGNVNYRESCFISNQKGNDYEKLVKCGEKRFYSVSPFDSNKQYLVKILVSVRKTEENAKL